LLAASPASAPESAIASTMRRCTGMPAARAARSEWPTARTSNPQRVRERRSAEAAASTRTRRRLRLTGAALWNQSAELCCACGLCTLYACPEDLFPKETCDQAKADMRAAGNKYVQVDEPMVHPMKDSRRVPLAMLRKRLKVEQYEAETPYQSRDIPVTQVKILLKQHAGATAHVVVAAGDRVTAGQRIADVRDDELGAAIHASISGTVSAVSPASIEIRA